MHATLVILPQASNTGRDDEAKPTVDILVLGAIGRISEPLFYKPYCLSVKWWSIDMIHANKGPEPRTKKSNS